MNQPLKKLREVSPVFVLMWLALTVSGTIAMMSYSQRPGRAASPPVQWPAQSKVAKWPIGPTLVMFIHPKCSCSEASISELSLLMSHCQQRVQAHVLFVKPPGQATNWVQTDTWRDASRIPGVTVGRDDEGREARLFGAATSGEVVLYDTDGRLRFHGGITYARGHSGDNAGRDAVQAVLFHEAAKVTQTPVFGCDLLDCSVKDGR